MNVGELRELLSNYDDHTEVRIWEYDNTGGDMVPVTGVCHDPITCELELYGDDIS